MECFGLERRIFVIPPYVVHGVYIQRFQNSCGFLLSIRRVLSNRSWEIGISRYLIRPPVNPTQPPTAWHCIYCIILQCHFPHEWQLRLPLCPCCPFCSSDHSRTPALSSLSRPSPNFSALPSTISNVASSTGHRDTSHGWERLGHGPS
jgi:hypothetical protein